MENSPRTLIVEGNLRRALLSLALPMAAGHLAHNFFSLTDMYFVGKLGSVAVAAVGMAGVVMSAIIVLMVGLSTATRAIVARNIGANDIEGAHKAAVATILFGLAISVLIAIGGLLFGKLVLMLMNASGEMLEEATSYLIIMMLGGFAMVMLFAINAILQGAGDARTAMIITFIAVILNILLDPLFIFGIGPFPKWGIQGAAFATVLARFIGTLIGFIILIRGVKAFRFRISKFHTSWAVLKHFIHIGIPGGGQVLLNNLMGFIMMRFAAGFGIAVTAAYTIGIRLNMMALLPGYALGAASGALVGQNLGAEKPQRAKKGAINAVKIYQLYIIPIGIAYFIFAPRILALFTQDTSVIENGMGYLRTISIFYPIFAIGTILMRTINGAGKTIPPMIAIFIALYIIQFPVVYFLSPAIGPDAIWYAIAAGMIGQGIIIIPYFISMKWAETGRMK